MIKERGVIQVKGKGEMLTSYVLGRKISRSWHFGRTVSSGNNSLAEVVYGMVRARKRRTGRRGRLMGDPCGGVACILQGGPLG